jgi:hypothetical protein
VEPIAQKPSFDMISRLNLKLTGLRQPCSRPLAERKMRHRDHCVPLSGPDSDPVLYGVAQGLAELFPPVELTPVRDDQGEQIDEADPLADDA